MDQKKLLFIYNPHAGKEALKSKLSYVIEKLMEEEFSVNICATRHSGEATELVAEQAEYYDRIICSGGDGTLHETMVGMMSLPKHKRCPCGYIPTGTVNDFANGMGIPKKIQKAIEIASAGEEFLYDIGKMNDQYFNYIVAFGAFTAVSYETPQATKNVLGKGAYFLDALTKLPSIKSHHAIIKVDENEVIEDDFVLGMVTNAKSVGGFPLFRKSEVSLNDGFFEGIFVKNPKNPIELQATIASMLSTSANDQIIIVRGKRFEIVGEEAISYTIDGEDGGEYQEVLIENQMQAMTYIKEHNKTI